MSNVKLLALVFIYVFLSSCNDNSEAYMYAEGIDRPSTVNLGEYFYADIRYRSSVEGDGYCRGGHFYIQLDEGVEFITDRVCDGAEYGVLPAGMRGQKKFAILRDIYPSGGAWLSKDASVC